MKPRRKRSKNLRVLRLWSWAEVSKAVPYLHSVTQSLREHWLDVLNAQRRLDRGAKIPGPVKRQQMIEEATQHDDRHRAQTQFDDALTELNQVDVYLLDPVQGLALVPFRKEDDLAWYVFDHFSANGVIGWRYHNDPIEECRPLTDLPNATETDANHAAASLTE